MSQSDERIPGRSGEPRIRPSASRMPASFGRPMPEEPIEVPAAAPPSPVSVVGGSVVLEVGAELVIGQAAAQAFYDQVKELTMLALSDGFAEVMGARPGDDQADEPEQRGVDEPPAGAST